MKTRSHDICKASVTVIFLQGRFELMLTVENRHAIHRNHARRMDTSALRNHFLAENLFEDREVRLVYTHYDRFVSGATVPAGDELTLNKVDETRTATFLERREMGIVNIGESGTVGACSPGVAG